MADVAFKRRLEFDAGDSPCRQVPKRRRRMPLRIPSLKQTATTPSSKCKPSPFGEVATTLTQEQILANVQQELGRLQRRKRKRSSVNRSLISVHHHPQDSAMNGSPTSPSSPASCSSSSSPSNAWAPSSNSEAKRSREEKSVLTCKEMNLICERMMKEHETKIREEYDRIFTQHLSEQYDGFVQFTLDQQRKRFETSAVPSYMS